MSLENTIKAGGDILKAIRPGILMIILGAAICLVGAFEGFGDYTVNPIMANKIYYAGMIMFCMGAFFSWYKGKMDALKIPSMEVYEKDKIEREHMLDTRFSAISSEVDIIGQRVADILYEVKPNGGGSMKDGVRRIESSVANIAARNRAMTETSDHAFFETDIEGNFLYVNSKYGELVGRMGQDTLGNGWFTAIHPSDRAKVSSDWRQAIRDRRGFEATFRFLTPAGENRLVLCKAHPMVSEGDQIGWLGRIDQISGSDVSDYE